MVQVLRSVYDAMVAHALETPAVECCGLLSGKDGTITRHFPATNVAESKAVRYEASPHDVVRIFQEIDRAGEQHLGIYHSHVSAPAYPSATDRKLAAYDVTYVVISLRHRARPEVRAFRIEKEHPAAEDGEVREEAIEIVDAAGQATPLGGAMHRARPAPQVSRTWVCLLMRVTRAVYDAMVAHALEERPFEACGVLAGSGGTVTQAHRARNAAELSGVRYEIDGREFVRINTAVDDADLDLIGIYHSHPFTRAYPSATDLAQAWEGLVYAIVSLRDFPRPEVRAFTVAAGEILEQPVEIVEEPAASSA